MAQDEGPSGSAARWILALAVLTAVVGLILVLVARRRAPEEARPSPEATGSRPASTARQAEAPADDLAQPPRVVDRRRLAEHLRRLRRQAGSAPHPGASGEGAGRGPGPRAGAGRGGQGAKGAAEGEDEDEDEDDVQWPVSRDGIRGAIRARISEIKECYEGWLSEDPALGGRLVVSFAIEADDDGETRIREAGIRGADLEHSGLERCLLVMVESLQFEPPPGGRVVVRYPFNFSPGPDQAPPPAAR